MAERRTEVAPREERGVARREPFADVGSPFRLIERFADEMDRVFEDFGFGRAWPTSRVGRGLFRSPWSGTATGMEAWAPDVEVFHRNDELVVRADLPGMSKEDIKVDVTESAITIQGERKRAREEEREGVYRSERSYGRFYRTIPVPEDVITDQAKAAFKDGVLEITMPAAPEQVRRGRRLEISESGSGKK
jgi:HSP20 family protein